MLLVLDKKTNPMQRNAMICMKNSIDQPVKMAPPPAESSGSLIVTSHMLELIEPTLRFQSTPSDISATGNCSLAFSGYLPHYSCQPQCQHPLWYEHFANIAPQSNNLEQETVMDLSVNRCANQQLKSLKAEERVDRKLSEPSTRSYKWLDKRHKMTNGSSNTNKGNRATRRNRTMFSEWQLNELEWRFIRNKYLITSDRIRVAKMLNLEQLQVKTWFQNRRMKWKKQILASGSNRSPTKPKGRPRRDSIPPIDTDNEDDRAH